MLTTAILVFLSVSLSSQSFKRGTIVFDANMGLEGLNTTQMYEHPNALLDTIIRRDAGNINFSFGFEVGISNRIGIGLRGKANNYFDDINALTRDRTQIRSNDILLTVAWHPLKRRLLGLAVGADMGLSDIDFAFENNGNTSFSSKGQYFAFFVNPRFYIRRFGINIRASLPRVNYGRFGTEASNLGSDYSLERWKASGIGVSVGVQYRLF
jgi:hypothetical protein